MIEKVSGRENIKSKEILNLNDTIENVQMITAKDFQYIKLNNQIVVLNKNTLEIILKMKFDNIKSMTQRTDQKINLVVFNSGLNKFMQCQLDGLEIGFIKEIKTNFCEEKTNFGNSILEETEQRNQKMIGDIQVIQDPNTG